MRELRANTLYMVDQILEISREDEVLLKRINAAVFVLILTVALVGTSLPLFAQAEEIIARVNGVEITVSQFMEALEAKYGEAVLEELIINEVLAQKQAELGIDDAYLAKVYDDFVARIGGPDYLVYLLYQYGITEEQLKKVLLIDEMVLYEIEADPEAVKAWFEENRAQYDREETVTASHILVDSREKAEELLAQLQDGADFAALAREHSLDTGSAVRGGQLGEFGRGVMVEPFEATAFSLGVGEMGIAESQFGWHIIWVTGRTEAVPAVLDEIYTTVEKDYKRSVAPSTSAYLQQLEDAAQIEILRERYQHLVR